MAKIRMTPWRRHVILRRLSAHTWRTVRELHRGPRKNVRTLLNALDYLVDERLVNYRDGIHTPHDHSRDDREQSEWQLVGEGLKALQAMNQESGRRAFE